MIKSVVTLVVSLLVGLFGIDNIGLPECPTEDSSNCYWYAPEMGNGQGTSFVNVLGVTVYFDI